MPRGADYNTLTHADHRSAGLRRGMLRGYEAGFLFAFHGLKTDSEQTSNPPIHRSPRGIAHPEGQNLLKGCASRRIILILLKEGLTFATD